MKRYLRHRYVLFTGARYLGYILLFVRGLVIASALTPSELGVWGFLILLIEYLGYTNVGVPYAINVELSVRGQGDVTYAKQVINHSFGILVILTVILQGASFILFWFNIEWFPEYRILPVIIFITVIASLMQGYTVFQNIFRAYDKIAEVIVTELSVTIVTLAAAIFLPAPMLIHGLLWAMIGGYAFSLLVFGIRSPISIRPEFGFAKMKPLVLQGVSLLIYNLSFYLMTMTARSAVGFFYNAEEMGFFTLANSLASAIMLGINSLLWIVYPKILYVFRPGVATEVVVDAMEDITYILQKVVNGIVLLAATGSPLILYVLPRYSSIFPTLYYLLLTQAFLLGSGASNSLAVARNKEKNVAKIGLVMVATLLAILAIIIVFGGKAFVVSIALMFTAGIYTLMMNAYAYKLLGVQRPWVRSAKLIFKIGDFAPVLVTAIIAVTPFSYLAGAAGLILYIIINAPALHEMMDRVRQISRLSIVPQSAQ